jgi:hypothetical protein
MLNVYPIIVTHMDMSMGYTDRAVGAVGRGRAFRESESTEKGLSGLYENIGTVELTLLANDPVPE